MQKCDSQVFETVDAVKVSKPLASIASLFTSAVKLSRLWGPNFSGACANY